MLGYLRISSFEPLINQIVGLARIINFRQKSAKSFNPLNLRFRC